MSSVNLSLDEIIAKTRASKGKGRGQDSSFKSDDIKGRRGGNGGGARRSNNGGGQRSSGAFSKNVPGGKWRHDKFSESEGGRGGGRSASSPSAPRGGLATAISANKKVRVNVSNLAASVSTADLEELFAQYAIDSAAVHYAEGGEHLGTGDVVMKKRDAQKALVDFQGVSVDGSRLSMAIVEGGAGGSIFDRVQMVKKVPGGGITKRSRDDARPQRSQRPRSSTGGGRHPLDRFDEGEKGGNKGGRGGGRGGPNRGGRKEDKPKSEAELDAELDAYMKKGHSAMES